MDYHDRFVPSIDNQSETETESESETEIEIEIENDHSISSKTKELEKYKTDKGKHMVYRKLNKRHKIYFYETKNTPRTLIRNAVSGHYQMNCLVGTKDEDHFFKVRLCTGETGPDPPLLFFDDPGQYERHFMTNLPQETKEKWNKKYIC